MKATLINAVLVGAGGFIGALARFGVNSLAHRNAALAGFPYGTLIVNMLGCLLVGVAVGLIETREGIGPDFRLFVVVGLLGGFTTWSAFGFETFLLIRDAQYLKASANVLLQVVLGLAGMGRLLAGVEVVR